MLVLIAHGSRDPQWRRSLEDLTASLKTDPSSRDVELAFMQFDGPTLPDVIGKAVDRGTREFRLLPLFMASAGHVDKDIRPLVEELKARYPGVVLELLTPIGESPLFWQLVQTIADIAPSGGRS